MEIKLISVGEILNSNKEKDKQLKFFVPSYQRGYRWTERQVEDLLNDIWEFNQKEKRQGEFYCLQPVVVKNIGDNEYEVIDGQQRLTTIYIILSYLRDIRKLLGFKKIFSIDYKTREGSKKFLEEFEEKEKDHITEEDKTNVDYYYMSKAYLCIKNWFDKYPERQIDFLNLLIKSEIQGGIDKANNVRFIWYEVDEKANGVEIFTRINMGKIPLTNAELIKALFLKRSNFDKDEKDEKKIKLRQLEIANEWDNIEYSLQNDEFWYFLNKEENNISTRIEFIFDLIANEIVENPEEFLKEINKKIGDKNKNTKEAKKQIEKFKGKRDDYRTFMVFNTLFEYGREDEKAIIEYLWEKIKSYFLTFQERFNDRELYHKIGYLITVGVKIEDLIKKAIEKTKSEFKEELDNWIKESISIKKSVEFDGELEDLEYGQDNQRVTNILLLFNIMTLWENKDPNARFLFDRFKKEKWSLEHIHARNSKSLRGTQLAIWLERHKEALENNIRNLDFDTKHLEYLKDMDMFKELFDKFQKDEDKAQLKSEIIKKTIQKIEEIIKKKKKIEEDEINKIQTVVFRIFNEEENINSIENLTLLSFKANACLSNDVFAVKRQKIIDLDKKGSFIPICTKNLFLKYYSKNPSQLYFWSERDRKCYLEAIKETIKDYLPMSQKEHKSEQ